MRAQCLLLVLPDGLLCFIQFLRAERQVKACLCSRNLRRCRRFFGSLPFWEETGGLVVWPFEQWEGQECIKLWLVGVVNTLLVSKSERRVVLESFSITF